MELLYSAYLFGMFTSSSEDLLALIWTTTNTAKWSVLTQSLPQGLSDLLYHVLNNLIVLNFRNVKITLQNV